MSASFRTPAIDGGDERLLERCRGGDRGAFEALLAPHHAIARALATRLLGHVEDGEDAVQDAMLKTFMNLSAFRPERGSLRAWFLRIVYNQCADARRRSAARRRHESEAPPAAPRAPEGAAEARETLAAVHAAIDRLPPRQRAALHLRVVDELPYAEIAQVLELSPQSARVAVMRARATLRELLARELDAR